jgi:cytochrome c-type biogenesis protein CcmF
LDLLLLLSLCICNSGLWKKQYGEWTKQGLPWALFSAAVLGVGIMMGAMWAYESLTFGGYWAWDPVENASLVPWLILISGIHTLLIYKHTGYSLRATNLFFILSFGFILYSTFLTRTGVLGDTSVHAFTGEGSNMLIHLLLFMAIFLVPAFILFFNRYREIPALQKEENSSSREFWMFIGSLVFFLSALVIIGRTSVPVINKIFGTKNAPSQNEEFWYNQIHVFVAIIIALLTAAAQYLKYKETPSKYFWKKILIPTALAAVAATLVLVYGKVNYEKEGAGFMVAIWIAVACSVYTIIANAAYIWLGIKGKLKLSGGSVAHVGFGMVLLES